LNNPTSRTDPTGYLSFGELLGVAIGVVAAWFGQYELARESWGWAFTASVGGGFLSAYVATGSLKAGLWGAFAGGMFFEIGSYFQSASWAHDTGVSCSVHLSTGGHLAKIAAHAAAGGILQHLQGGRFGSGFLAAGATETLSPAIEHVDHLAGRILTAAMIGGTVSTLSGGKFANGAATAAFAQAFNEEIHRAEEGAHESERYGKTTANPGLQRIIIFGEPGSTNTTKS
jgi:hypothetical protein